ncbi:hypothetical protein [Undibacterium sp.]|uniref:hypothetical protein n=1 Tax=Undibacterium sp. TaxID=1914977 RepID=UPI002B752C57|nr:hypothetical protein [Undibacterium sp.]HTD03309.1 hypothetical protein [Undibacterium sp.]
MELQQYSLNHPEWRRSAPGMPGFLRIFLPLLFNDLVAKRQKPDAAIGASGFF